MLRNRIAVWFRGVLALCLLCLIKPLYAYPFLVSEGYTTCATCHYNPSGGGSLTPYGKFIAQELLGTFNDSSTALPWLSKPEPDQQIIASVMLRGAQTYFDTPQVTRSKFRKMQADLELGWAHPEGWQILGAVGPKLDAAGEGSKEASEVFVRRYWVGKVTGSYAVRIGRFFPEYGIAFPNHNIPTRKGLYFNHDQEPHIAQATHFGSSFDISLAAMQGAKETLLENKKGYSSTLAYRDGKLRAGVSRLDMRRGAERSEASGAFAQVGYAKKGYTLVDVHQKAEQNVIGRKTRSDLGYVETGWAFEKGVQPYLAGDYSYQHQTRLGIVSGYVGLQFHPWTHTECVLQWGQSAIRLAGARQTAKQGLAMFNVYF